MALLSGDVDAFRIAPVLVNEVSRLNHQVANLHILDISLIAKLKGYATVRLSDDAAVDEDISKITLTLRSELDCRTCGFKDTTTDDYIFSRPVFLFCLSCLEHNAIVR